MGLVLAVYGKGGIGKSTVSANLSAALAQEGASVLQIGCDPKHDSTFPLTGMLQNTVIDTLSMVNFHHEEIEYEDIIKKGFGGVDTVESGGPPAGSGCGGYVVGETVKLLKEFGVYSRYDVILFDVLGDVVCGGFSAPLNYADMAFIVATNDFDSIFAANRLCIAVEEKSTKCKVKLAGIIANKVDEQYGGGTALLEKFANRVQTTIATKIPYHDLIRRSRLAGKTLFQMEGEGKAQCTEPYQTLARKILNNELDLRVPKPMGEREIFDTISGWM